MKYNQKEKKTLHMTCVLIENLYKRILFTFSVSSRGLSSINALAGFVKLVGLPSEMKIILGYTQKAPILWMRSNIEYFTFPLRVRLMCAIINKFQFNINIDQFRRSINH